MQNIFNIFLSSDLVIYHFGQNVPSATKTWNLQSYLSLKCDGWTYFHICTQQSVVLTAHTKTFSTEGFRLF